MSLEQWSDVAQIAASIAVIASLIYVARQLTQNIALMRVNASSERVQRDFDLAQALIESREITEIWLKGASEFDRLDPADKTRLMFFERRAIVHWNNMFGLHEEGLLPEPDWRELKWLIRNLGQRQAIRETWSYFRDAFDESFQDFMQEQFALGDESQARGSEHDPR